MFGLVSIVYDLNVYVCIHLNMLQYVSIFLLLSFSFLCKQLLLIFGEHYTRQFVDLAHWHLVKEALSHCGIYLPHGGVYYLVNQ